MTVLIRRAVWCVLSQIVFDNDGAGDKARWKEDARLKLYSAIDKAAAGTLSASRIRHSAYKRRSKAEEERLKFDRVHGDELRGDDKSWGSTVESSVKSSSGGTYNSDRGRGGDHDGNKADAPAPELSDSDSDGYI